MDSIPLEQCQKGGLYRIHSRNLCFGVFDGHGGFVGIREKFGSEYLFTEYHWDFDAYCGTVKPVELLEICPLSDIRESLGIVDDLTKREVAFGQPVKDGGRGWYFVDTDEDSLAISPRTIENEALFDYLEAKTEEYK